MGRVEPAAGLDVTIAERYARPFLDRVLDMLEDEARARAPEVKVWVTARDERVRKTHFETDTQAVPENLRFKVPNLQGTGHDLARAPRDQALPIGNRINCRCAAQLVPHLLRDSIHRTDVNVQGTRVTGSVETRFARAAESEFGTSEDSAAHYMTGALQEVAARLRSGQRR